MHSYLYVAIGSAGGGLARFVLGGWIQRRFDGWVPRAGAFPFPVGTLLVNVTGSFILGLLVVVLGRRGEDADAMRLLMAVGFCGGYTTFSTFSYETAALLKDGEWTRAGFYVAASVLLSIAGMFLGFGLAREIVALRGRI